MKTLLINTPQLREYMRRRYESFIFTSYKDLQVGEEVKLDLSDKNDIELIGDNDVLKRRYKVKAIHHFDVFDGIEVEEIK